MDNVMISVIIPVFNCEKYLEECLESVISQSLDCMEIVCVDDGSTDGSYVILQKYAKKYDFVHVYTQKNSGAGNARNLGISKAKGEFIAFLDADDFYIDVDALEKMYTTCKLKGVSICGSYGKVLEGNRYRNAGFYDTTNIKAGDVHFYSDFQMDCGYTTFIYKRKLIEENRIIFPNYRRFQDPPFMVKAMYYANQFTMADTQLYCYRAPNLINRLNQEKIIDLLKGIRDNLQFALEHNLNKLFEGTLRRLETDYLYMILHNISGEIVSKNSEAFMLLLSINNMVQTYLQDEEYLLGVLQMLMKNSSLYCKEYNRIIYEKIVSMEQIAVYGAGKYAKNFLRYLEDKSLLDKVKYIVVSSCSNNDETIWGKQVIDLETFIMCENRVHIFVAVGATYHKDIEDRLIEKQYLSYELLDDAFLGQIG